MRLTDALLSKINLKKCSNGDLAYINTKLKLRSHKDENSLDIDVPEKSKNIYSLLYKYTNYVLKYCFMLFIFSAQNR